MWPSAARNDIFSTTILTNCCGSVLHAVEKGETVVDESRPIDQCLFVFTCRQSLRFKRDTQQSSGGTGHKWHRASVLHTERRHCVTDSLLQCVCPCNPRLWLPFNSCKRDLYQLLHRPGAAFSNYLWGTCSFRLHSCNKWEEVCAIGLAFFNSHEKKHTCMHAYGPLERNLAIIFSRVIRLMMGLEQAT